MFYNLWFLNTFEDNHLFNKKITKQTFVFYFLTGGVGGKAVDKSTVAASYRLTSLPPQ